MELVSAHYFRFVAAFVLVIGLVLLLAWLAKRFRIGTFPTGGTGSSRLEIVESLAIDTRQRLLIVRRDQREHLLLIGPERSQVVETGFSDPVSKAEDIETTRLGAVG